MHSYRHINHNSEEENSLPFVAFKARHLNEEIEGIELYEEIYGKEKVRTLHVLLVLCLNLTIDPPDLLAKVSPCAKMEAWFDPKEKNLARALEMIGKNLQNQYERWQPKARYRQSLDPTIEEVHRLCQSLRRSARDERFLFHYNGHGVPRPTENGEIWVFNKTYTKYIPLSLYDLQGWMGGPSVYVFDCNNAGRIIKMMESFCNKRQESNNTPAPYLCPMETNIILAACQENEDIPTNPEIPADLFTACLTTPIKMALYWYLLRNKAIFPDYLQDSMLDLIVGSPSNRVSMFGEINWVFTAVTDTIAWSCLPTALFQRLFRQDLLVASLFRNFLLAERIMHHYGVRPQSYPVLPHTYNHPMWDAWDHALDGYMTQLPGIQRWKDYASSNDNDENLPIIHHPPDDPPYICQSNLFINDSSDDDDDDIEEDEDSIQLKITNDQLMPRSVMMTHDFTDNRANKPERFFIDKNIQPRNTGNTESNNVIKPQINNQIIRNDEDVLRIANIDNAVNKNPTPVYMNPKAPIIPGIRASRSNSQSNKTIASVVKTNTINPLNGSSSDYVMFKHTEFFNDHMTAFDIWLKTADEKKPVPVQLPILLQVLLSQTHRHRALRLISEYMDLGKWAVVQCLTVGIFPYIIRLLQSPVSDVKPYLVFIWGKIISSAQTDFAKNDVVKDAGYKYFVSCLMENEPYEEELGNGRIPNMISSSIVAPNATDYSQMASLLVNRKRTQKIIVKTIAVFALAKMLNNNPAGQRLYIKQNITTVLISELENNGPELKGDNYIRLRVWFILCFAKLWSENDEAKWYGVRQKIHEKLMLYLKDISPEVRAATIYALGTFLNNKADDGIRSKHSVQVEQHVCQHLLNHSIHESSPLVRAELVVTMKYMVNLFSNQVVSMAVYYDDWMLRNSLLESGKFVVPSSPTIGRNLRSRQGSIPGAMSCLANDLSHDNKAPTLKRQHPQFASSANISIRQKAVSNGDISDDCHVQRLNKRESISPTKEDILSSGCYTTQRSGQKSLTVELPPNVSSERKTPTVSNFTHYNSTFPISNVYAQMWGSLVQLSKDPHYKVSLLATRIVNAIRQKAREYATITESLTSSKDVSLEPPGSPKISRSPVQLRGPQLVKHSAFYPTHKHKVDQISGLTSSDSSSGKSVFSNEENIQFDFSNVTTEFFNWSSKYFTQPLLPLYELTSQIPSITTDTVTCNRVEYTENMLNKSRSFDKVSGRNLPNLNVIEQKANISTRRLMHVVDVAIYEDRNNLMKKQENMRDEGAHSWRTANSSLGGSLLSQVFLQKMNTRPELMKFHPYLNYLAVADYGGVSLWNWESGHRAQYMLSPSVTCRNDLDNDQQVGGFITSLEFINYEEERGGLLSVGTMDGKIKIWRNYLRDMGQDPDIVTAWQALTDPIGSERQSGLITHWSQVMGQLTLSGDVRYVRLWDSTHESKISDMHTNCDSCVTTIDRTQDGRLVVAGFGNGHIKMFDIRAPSNASIINAGVGDSGWIQKVAFSERCSQVYSVGIHGEVNTWSLKQRSQPKSNPSPGRRNTPGKKDPMKVKSKSKDGIKKSLFEDDTRFSLGKTENHVLKTCDVVHCADLRVSSDNYNDHLAIIGYSKESRGILTACAKTGNVTSNFKFFEGFSRANIETPTAVCVHPYQCLVGAGLSDCNLLLLKLQAK